MNVSIVLPSYNEKDNILPLIRQLLDRVKGEIEIIVVDDNSPDGTWKIVKEIEDERVRLIRRMNERGLASAIRKGIESSRGDIVVIMDTDFSHPPETVPALIATTSDFHIARGSRYVEGGCMESSKKRVFLSKMTNLFAQLMLGFDIKDYTTNFFAAKREVFDDIKILDRWGMHGNYSIGLLYVAKKKGYEIKEVPFVCRDRTSGTTKISTDNSTLFRWGIRYCLTVLRLRFKNP